MDPPPVSSLPTVPSTQTLLEHAAWVRRVARALVQGPERAARADELEQETWVSALAHPPRHTTDLKRWLAAVARNVARKLLRADATRQHHALQQRHEGGQPSADHAPAAAELVARAELQQRVAAAVLALAEPYRSTLLARYVEELPPMEIARTLGVSIETVKTRLKRGLAQLRDQLDEGKGDGSALEAALAPLCVPFVGPSDLSPMPVPVSGPLSSVSPAGAKTMVLVTKIAASLVIAVLAPLAAWKWKSDGSATGGGAPVVTTGVPVSMPTPTPPSAPDDSGTTATREALANGDTDADAPAPGVPAQTGTIHGVVVDENGAPAAGATVFVGRQVNRSFESFEEFRRSSSSLLTAGGDPRYFDWRKLTADAAGAFDCNEVAFDTIWAIGAAHPEAGVGWKGGVSLAAEAPHADLEIELLPGIVLRGTVRDRAGQPIAGAGGIIDGSNRQNEHRISLPFECDDQGEFRTLPLPWHWVRFQLTGPGMMETFAPTQEIPQDVSEWRIDLVLDPIVTLHGRILDPAGEPANLVELLAPTLTKEELAQQSRETFAVLALSADPRTDAQALASVRPQRPNQWSSYGGWGYGTVSFTDDTYDLPIKDARMKFVALLVRDRVLGVAEIVAPGNAPDLEIDPGLLPTAPLLVPITLHQIDGTTGKPVDQSDIDAHSVGFTPEGWDDHTSLRITGFDGPADLHLQLHPGEWLIYVQRGPYANRLLRLTLRPGMEPLELTLALFPADGVLRGDVLDADGQPIAGAELLLYRLPEIEPAVAWSFVPGVSDARGAFELRNVSSNPCALVAWKPGFAPAVAKTATTPEGGRCSVTLRPGFTVHPSFRDVDGSPLREVHWRLLDHDGIPVYDDEFLRRSSPHSYFDWPDARDGRLLLTDGDYTLVATGPQFRRGITKFTSAPGLEVVVTLEEAPR